MSRDNRHVADRHQAAAIASTAVLSVTMIALVAYVTNDLVIALSACSLIAAVAALAIAAITRVSGDHSPIDHDKPRHVESLTAWVPRSQQRVMGLGMDERPRDL
jgi:hypothetical protein